MDSNNVFNNPEFMNQLVHALTQNPDFAQQLTSVVINAASTSGTSSTPIRNSRSNFKPSKPEKYDGTESRTTAHLFEIRQYLA
eukprot:Nk52_evm1s722 gene=Nk52_evmTU1s722